MTYKFRDWEFEVDVDLTMSTYSIVSEGGADKCESNNCMNYVEVRESIFPEEIKTLFSQIGIDYRKEVEVTKYQKLPNGLHHIGGWFHFKGQVLSGKDYHQYLSDKKDGFITDLTRINDNFSIGFGAGNTLAFFEDKTELVQVEFEANIPWVISKSLEDDW